MKELQLLGGGFGAALHVVVADVALGFGVGCGGFFGRWGHFFASFFDPAEGFPSRGVGCGWEFFNRDVFDLNQADTAAVHLGADLTVERDVGIDLVAGWL